MGFLKFLKRGKKEEELDLPPAPPPLEGFEELDLPEMPDIEKISAPDDFKFDVPNSSEPLEERPEEQIPVQMPQEPETSMPDASETEFPEHMPEFDSQPQIEQDVATIQQEAGYEEQHPLIGQEDHPLLEEEAHPLLGPKPEAEESRVLHPHHAKRLFVHEKKEHRMLPKGKSIYVRVDKFKATLGSINVVRKDLKKADEALLKMENVKSSKDKSFEKLRLSLDDLQKRLIFIDKTLFKGD